MTRRFSVSSLVTRAPESSARCIDGESVLRGSFFVGLHGIQFCLREPLNTTQQVGEPL